MRVPKPPSGETDNMFPAPEPKDVRFEEIIAELQRELDMRKAVYPKWIEATKIDPEVAAARMLYVEAAIMWLERLANTVGVIAELERQDPEDVHDDQVES